MLKQLASIVLMVIFAATCVYGAESSELVIGSANIPQIDPHNTYMTSHTGYAAHVFNRLVDLDGNLKIIPELATSWKRLNRTTWEFTLRKGAKFHDGSVFTAEDVVASINRITNNTFGGISYKGLVSSIGRMKILGPHRLIIFTKAPDPTLLQKFTRVAIISHKFEESPTSDFGSGKAMVGTGPYKFCKIVHGKYYKLERNEDYWRDKPAYENVTFVFETDSAKRIAALKEGKVDIIDYVDPSQAASLKEAGFTVVKCPSDRTMFMQCDTIRDKPNYVTDKKGNPLPKNPLRDLRVRKAISKAIDRKKIVNELMSGYGHPSSQFNAKGRYGYNDDLEVEAYDPKGAKKLLAEAGYPEGFSLIIHGPSGRYVNDVELLKMLAEMLTDVGIDTKAVTIPRSEFFKRVKGPNNAFSFMMFGWSTSLGDPGQPLTSISHSFDGKFYGTANGIYANPELDEVIEQAVKLMDPAARERGLKKAMAMAMADYAPIVLYNQELIFATTPNVTLAAEAHGNILAQNAKPKEQSRK